MADGIYTALTGAVAQQQQLDVIANNVANANTAGFRGDRAAFTQFLAGAQKTQLPPVSQSGMAPQRPDQFVRVAEITHDTADGALKLTGNQLDFALSGDGFFTIDTPQGERLTRAGNFVMRPDGRLSTPEGHDVIGDNGKPLRVPTASSQIQVSTDGVVSADGQAVGKFKLMRVQDPSKLQRESQTTFVAAKGTAVLAKDMTVTQGHLEASNVNAVAGLNELITVNRSFDALQKVIETFQKIDDRTARDLGSRT